MRSRHGARPRGVCRAAEVAIAGGDLSSAVRAFEEAERRSLPARSSIARPTSPHEGRGSGPTFLGMEPVPSPKPRVSAGYPRGFAPPDRPETSSWSGFANVVLLDRTQEVAVRVRLAPSVGNPLAERVCGVRRGLDADPGARSVSPKLLLSHAQHAGGRVPFISLAEREAGNRP
jgi:hypothetical protein